ncbi:uncharacterized protein LOC123540418 [Mercenaria mercenaria]|uniref:uncharacterized protein LOC123540418 n=1 Tax=Mercenaria mercenaria TaxID=6596 RepID=UPI00234E7C9A|nr:uncharacterized protein LOC123540418 [Mercenaria mercenaria]
MAQYKVLDPEQEVICPYDPNHRPRARGIQSHLINCRKNNPHMKLEICQFNATHHVPRSEYRHHLMTCPDKAMMELEFRYEARAGQVLGGCTQVPVYQDMNIPSSEDWDADVQDVTNTFNGIILHRSGNQPRQQPISYNCGLNQTYNKSGKQATSFDTSPKQPRFQPVEQPVSSIYAYSVSRGRGRGRGRGCRIEQTEQDIVCNPENSFGRGGGAGPSLVSAQLGSTVPFPKGLVEKRF